MYSLICAAFTSEGQGLVFIEHFVLKDVPDDVLIGLFEKWEIPTDFKYPSKGSISDVFYGKQSSGNVLHFRIVRF
jgi:hypothetical protein